jgi:PhoPQ-activated pathogenicity-related protein
MRGLGAHGSTISVSSSQRSITAQGWISRPSKSRMFRIQPGLRAFALSIGEMSSFTMCLFRCELTPTAVAKEATSRRRN